MESNVKSPLRSWTLWAAFALIASQWLIPGVEGWVAEHEKAVLHSVGLIFAVLRLKTSAPTTINFSLWSKDVGSHQSSGSKD